MAKVKRDGRYDYDKLGVMSVSALLPCSSAGRRPSASPGAVAGICTWVGDRMKRFGSDFQQLTSVGTMAALSAIFTAPLRIRRAAVRRRRRGEGRAGSHHAAEVVEDRRVPVRHRGCAGGLPRTGRAVRRRAVVASFHRHPRGRPSFCGSCRSRWWARQAVGCSARSTACSGACPNAWESVPWKGAHRRAVLALMGIALPFTMFAGETQAEQLGEVWGTMTAFALLATGFGKVLVTPLCIRFGWRGGHFFPVIFAGISIGYGMAMLTGADPVFCLCASTAALVGGVMRQPLMTVLLLFLCFPVKGIVVMLAAAALGAAVPLPKALRAEQAEG
ncbi:MAG: chloride channel protein [Eggerthella lenta]